MKVAVIKCPIREDLEKKLQAWIEDSEWPMIDRVTHIIHANTHWLTIWYLSISDEVHDD